MTALPIRFRNIEEIRSRQAWRDGLDHSEHKLQQILGNYSFAKKDALACGLKSCRTIHQNGYVVQTVDGLETHIGKDCGARHFGVAWHEMHASYRLAAEDRDRREWLETVLQDRDALISKANELRSKLIATTRKVHEVAELFSREPKLSEALARVVRAGGVIQLEREVDAKTAERMNLPQNQRTHLETVARITAIEVVGLGRGKLSGDTLATRLQNDAVDVLDQFSASSLRDLNRRQRKLRVREMELVKQVIAQAEAHLIRSRQFLSTANLRGFSKLPVDRPNNRTERTLKHFSALTDEDTPFSSSAVKHTR